MQPVKRVCEVCILKRSLRRAHYKKGERTLKSADSQGDAQPAAALSGAQGDKWVRWGWSALLRHDTPNIVFSVTGH